MKQVGNIGIGFAALAAALFASAGSARAAGGAETDGGGKPVAGVVRQALERGLSVPGARIANAVEERGAHAAGDCRPATAEVMRPIDGSGRIAIKVSGHSARSKGRDACDVWLWVDVRVVAPVAVAARALAAGDRLQGATATEERELRAGHPPAAIGPASIATRALGAGQLIEATLVGEPTLRAGEAVKVLVVSGALVIEQSGRGAPCARGRNCATLSSGKLVEGDLVDGKLVVQSP